MLLTSLTLFLASGFVSAQDDIGCFVPGKCVDSNGVGISFPSNPNGCLQDCKDNADCLYFTYEFDDDLCAQLTECTELVVTDPKESTSGNVNCANIICSEVGQCEGNFLDYTSTASEEACIDTCVADLNCNWYSFNGVHDACTILTNCDTVDTTALDTVYGQRECREGTGVTDSPIHTTTMFSKERRPTLLVASDGHDAIDVIDLDGRICDPMPDNPNRVKYGFVKDEGSTPILCVDEYCREYNGGSWNVVYTLPTKHNEGAGAQFDDDTYMIAGGFAALSKGSSVGANDKYETAYWTSASDSFSSGPDLPSAHYDHCMVPLNSTHAIIAGGSAGSLGNGLASAYMVDRNTQLYTTLPSSTNTHYRPACGVAQTANGPEFVSVGMYNNGYVNIYNVEQGVWRQAANDFTGPYNYATGYVQWEDSFLIATSDGHLHEYDPKTEEFAVRSETFPDHNGSFYLLLLIDGTKLNCA